MSPKYPDIEVKLIGTSGNTGAIMGEVANALREAGVSSDEVDKFREELLSGDYNNVIQTCFRWVDVS